LKSATGNQLAFGSTRLQFVPADSACIEQAHPGAGQSCVETSTTIRGTQ
jgi:hypothetical protein